MRLTSGGVGRAKQKGATLIFVGLALVALLGVMSLAVDLGMLYVARNQAQRAADAAALAGANVFATTSCTDTGGCVTNPVVTTQATQQAESIGGQDQILGQAALIKDTDISFADPTTDGTEPQITVIVQRTSARGNPIPTIFGKILGVFAADVSAKATAEAYKPSTTGSEFAVTCVVPFLVPNCDPNHPVAATDPAANKGCNGSSAGSTDGATIACPPGVTGPCYPSYFFYPPGSNPPGAKAGDIVHKGGYPGGVIGEFWQLHWGTTGPSMGAAPSQWYLIAFTGQSGAQLRDYIKQCSPTPVACGSKLQTMNGKKVGPTIQGVEGRINASGLSPAQGVYPATGQPFQNGCASLSASCAQGQDIIDISSGPPFYITGGSGNPNPSLVGQRYLGPSPSTVSAPVYTGEALTPGGSQVTVVGLLRMFIAGVEHQGPDVPVDAIITDVGGCGSLNPPPTVTVAPDTVPIRLIQGPG